MPSGSQSPNKTFRLMVIGIEISIAPFEFLPFNVALMGVVIMATFLPRSAEKVPLLRSPIERLVMF